eukprot:9453220-Pyramimonas_sp.AAC.1
MPMLAEPDSGHRLLILYAGAHRLWQRCRRDCLRLMHDALKRRYWGAVAGRSTLDLSWLQAARGEAAAADDHCSVLLLMDYS